MITQDEVDKAFKRAADGQPTILSFTNHDFRDMEPEIEKMRRYISNSAKKFPKTPFYFSDAIHAMQSILELTPEKPELSAEIQPSSINGLHTLHIRAGRQLFGPQPYLALKLKDGRYCWENLDVQSDNHWSFTFDQNHADMNMVEKIGVAANSASGTAEVITL